jgi:hypothetical protein
MQKAGSDLIRGNDALWHVEADRYRENSIIEYDSACTAAQPEDLIPGVRCVVVANILIGGRKPESFGETPGGPWIEISRSKPETLT